MTTSGTSAIALMPSTTSPSPAYSVGSPEPARAITSGLESSRLRTWSSTRSGSTHRSRVGVLCVVGPSWQYTQS